MIKRLYLASLVLSVFAGAFIACDGDDPAVTASPDSGAPDADVSETGTVTPDTGAPDSGADTGTPWDYKVTVLANFSVENRELPDDITILPGDATEFGTPVVGLNNTGKVAKLTGDGGYDIIAEFPAWGPAARLLGINWDPNDGFVGNVVSFGPFDAAVPPVGIYQIPADGGGPPTAITAAFDPNVIVPNVGRKLGDAYYIGDSQGWVAKVKMDGTTEKWATGEIFEGNRAACPSGPALATPRNLGADAVAVDANNVYVTNFDLGALIKVPVNADGTAGTPEVIYKGLTGDGTDCTLQTLDGLAIDTDGSFWVSNSLKNTLYHLSKDGQTLGDPVLQGKPPFDQISNMIIESKPGKKRLLISNFANGSYSVDAGPLPQLLQVDLPPDP